MYLDNLEKVKLLFCIPFIKYANPFGPKSKQRIFDSAVALFAECVFYFESLLVSALIKIHTLVEIPSRSERRE